MSEKFKILRIVGFQEPGGGGQKHILLLSQGLRARGHRDILLVPQGKLAAEFQREGCEVIPLIKGMGGFSSWIEIGRIIRREKPDIIHTHMPWADVVGVLGAMAPGTCPPRLVSTIHGYYFTNSRGEAKSPVKRQFYSLWLNMSRRRIITVSQALKNWLVQDFGVPAGRIITLHDGIEIKNLPPDFNPAQKRKEIGLEEEEIPVAVVGRLEPAKGQSTVIEALPLVIAKYPQVRVLLLGEGSERADLERKALEYKVKDKIKFLGYRHDLAEILGVCRAFILPSIKEGLSISLLEALGCGLPVMASKVGGVPEVVEDEVTGLLFPPRDAKTLAACWQKILDQPSWAKDLGKKGQEKVRQNFSIEMMVEGVEGVYKESRP